MVHYKSQNYHTLPNEIGSLFQIVFSILFIGCIGIMIYALFAKIISLAIVLSLLLIILYFKQLRHIMRCTTIWFNEDYVLLKKTKKISYSDVVGINKDHIIIEEGGMEKRIYFTRFESYAPRELLRSYWEKKNPEVAYNYTER